MTRLEISAVAGSFFILGAIISALLVSRMYERQLDRLAANPLCAAACNVIKAVKR